MTQFQTIEVIKDRYIEVDKALTAEVELIDLPDDFLTMSSGEAARVAGLAYTLQRTRAQACNGQLTKIANLGKPTE